MKHFEVPVYFDVSAEDATHAWQIIYDVLTNRLEHTDDDLWHSWLTEDPVEYDPENL